MIPYGKQTINDDDIKAVENVLKSSHLTTGNKVLEFEKLLSKYCGAKYVVVLSSGTAGLHLSSLVLLKEGDKVLSTPNSFLATSNSILYAKAKPIFVDIDDCGNINLDLCEEYLKKDDSIKAIYGVSFSGRMLNQEKLKYLREKYNVKILEDSAHSLGASFDGIKSGSSVNSDISIFSFHPVKHITTAEGGAITTNSKKIYENILSLRNHGIIKNDGMQSWEYEMRELGFNYRLNDISCALGISQLNKIENFIDKRVQIAKRYDKAFKDSAIKPLYSYDDNSLSQSSYHLYVVRVEWDKQSISKDDLFKQLKAKGILIQLHYIPINKQVFYKNMGYGNEKIPIMDTYYKQCFSLPIYPDLSINEQDYVLQNLFEILDC